MSPLEDPLWVSTWGDWGLSNKTRFFKSKSRSSRANHWLPKFTSDEDERGNHSTKLCFIYISLYSEVKNTFSFKSYGPVHIGYKDLPFDVYLPQARGGRIYYSWKKAQGIRGNNREIIFWLSSVLRSIGNIRLGFFT